MFGWDLQGCIEYNISAFSVDDVYKVLGYIEGQHDGEDYHWLLLLKDNSYVYLNGWCDYTGWDCQSSAEFARGSTPLIVLPDNEDGYELLRQYTEDDKQKSWYELHDEFNMPHLAP